MKKILVATVVTMTLVFGGGNIAEVEKVEVSPLSGFYVGGGLTIPQTYVDGEKSYFEDDTFNEYGLGLGAHVGYTAYTTGDFSVAVEGRVARSFWNYTDNDYTYNYGVYVKPEIYFVDSTVGVYALAGYTKVGVHYDNEVVDTDKTGFAYGAGVEYFVTDEFSVYGDYVMLPAFDTDFYGVNVNNDQFEIGVNYKF